ncbi:anti-sigma factor [Burkholderia sp. AU28942]|uniref:anti-sigma factor family protein n=1 Tax=Burkholderia TaxID=32008 RepID=UPI000841C818|nr:MULTISPECIES: anti-sigma factor [Burkholderia]AOK06240.1 anti-sigma factor [Burkholderia latens]MCA8308145.1 anti-sigma factor [Burkholderia sp. AU28942]QTO52077.1 anti-sigma factor [Burkholderia latens]
MNMDDIVLMAYVDGELTSHQREEVDRAIGTSADIATRVALFEASVLPYRRAFQRHPWPPVPQSLIRKVADIAHAHASPAALSASGDASRRASHAAQPGVRGRHSAPLRPRMRAIAPWLAAAFVAGAFCSAAILRFAPRPASVSAQTQMSPWIMAAVNYQRLYTRDTVAFDSANVAAAAHMLDTIRRDDGLGIRIPDLRPAGLAFKRIQRLNFNRKPLVQIVYLPDKGSPVALCVMKDERPDTVLDRQQVGNMDVATWRRSGVAYALIAARGDADLGALGDRIVDSQRS